MKTPDRIEIKKDGAHYFLDMAEVSEKEYRQRHPVLSGSGIFATASPKGWPYTSTSQGCHPKDRKKFMEHFAKMGVPTEFDKDGRAIFTSRQHQRQYCEVTGRVNYDENWSGKGPVEPPLPPKKRPKMGKANQVQSQDPPKMRTETAEGIPKRRRKSR